VRPLEVLVVHDFDEDTHCAGGQERLQARDAGAAPAIATRLAAASLNAN